MFQLFDSFVGKEAGYIGSLCICNVPESSLVRESDVSLMTRAGTEIGVASTKAFTTQLVVLRLLALALAKRRGMSVEQEEVLVNELHALPRQIEVVLSLQVVKGSRVDAKGAGGDNVHGELAQYALHLKGFLYSRIAWGLTSCSRLQADAKTLT